MVKPASTEVQALARVIHKYAERDIKSFAIESLWKFLIYTEVANAAAKRLNSLEPLALDEQENAFLAFMRDNSGLISDDFSVRLESCMQRLEEEKPGGARTVKEARQGVSEQLHGGFLRDLRKHLVASVRRFNRICILVDNLDKAWDQHADFAALAQVLFGLLNFTRLMGSDLDGLGALGNGPEVSLALFLRADIFWRVSRDASERDKMTNCAVTWTDPNLLLRIAEERYASGFETEVDGRELWAKFFCSDVNGEPVRSFITSRIFARPRDLIYLLNAAINSAVSNRRGIVEAQDMLAAEKEYSAFAFDVLAVEDTLKFGRLEDIALEFLGSNQTMAEDDVRSAISRAGIDGQQVDYVIDYLCRLGFLGIEVKADDFRFRRMEASFGRTRFWRGSTKRCRKRQLDTRSTPPSVLTWN